MTNYDAIDTNIKLTVGSGVVGGQLVKVGDITAVAITDADANDQAACHTKGVFTLAVLAEDDSGAQAIAEGDKLYLDGTIINVDSTNGSACGYALEAVASGTATIRVLLGQF